MPKVNSVFSKLTSPFLRGLVFAAYAASPLFGSKETKAAQPPEKARQSVVNFTSESVQRVRAEDLKSQDKSIDWHNLITALFVLGELDIKEVEDLRASVLSRGAIDSTVPFNVVQTAVCTSATWANNINKQIKDLSLKHETLLAELDELKESNPTRAAKEEESSELGSRLNDLLTRKRNVFELVSVFAGKAVVDSEVSGKKERKLVPEGEIENYFGGNGKTEIHDPLFLTQTNNALAQLCDQNGLDKAVSSFRAGSHNAQEMLVLSSGNPTVKFPNDARQYALRMFSTDRELAKKDQTGEAEEKPDSKPSYHNLDFKSKIFQANNILLLALNNDPDASRISEEWFRTKPAEKADEADFIALRALAICARSDQEVFNELGFIARTFPDVFDAYLYANNVFHQNLKRAAGQEVMDTFNANPVSAKKLLSSLANDPTCLSRTGVIVALSTMSDMKGNIDLLRGIISDSKSSEENKVAAMIGLARLRDKDSIKPLLKMAVNESNSLPVRVKALETVLIIDTRDPIPASYREKVADQYPLGLDMSFFDHYFKQGRIRTEFVDAVLRDSKLEENTVASLTKDLRDRFTYSSGYLAEMAREPKFCSEFLDPLVSSLNTSASSGNFDFRLGVPAILALANSHYEKASPVIFNCAMSPQSVARYTSKDQIILGAQRHSANQTFLRALGVEMSGEVIPLDSSGKDSVGKLFDLAARDDLMFRDLALRSLISLAVRYEGRNEFNDVKNAYLTRAVELLDKHRAPRSIYTTRSSDWYSENKREFDLCNLIFKLGGAEKLASAALEDKDSPLTRTIINVFVTNNFTPGRFNELKLSEIDNGILTATYNYHSKKEYSIPEGAPSGKGVTIAMVDGGIVMDKPGVTVPRHLISPFKLESQQYSPHANAVAGIIDAASDCNIISGSYDHPVIVSPFMPEYLQDPGYAFVKWLIIGNLTGSHQTDVMSQSWGYKPRNLSEPERRETTDIWNSILEFAVSAGIASASSAGNGNGDYYGSSSFGSAGNLNLLGFRVNEQNQLNQIPGQIIVGAYDPLTGLPLPFSGTPDALNPGEGIDVSCVDGVHLIPGFYDGTRQLGATSFSTPLESALLGRYIHSVRMRNQPDPLPTEIQQAVSDSSDKISGRADRVLDAKRFLFDTTKASKAVAP